MQISGWQRLWIFVSGIYLIIVIVFSTMSFPKPESIPHSQAIYDQMAPELKKKILSSEYSEKYQNKKGDHRVKMPNGHVMIFLSEIPESEVEHVAKEYWSVVENSTGEQRKKHIGFAFVLWVLPVLALYVFGWLAGWVYRGFKN